MIRQHKSTLSDGGNNSREAKLIFNFIWKTPQTTMSKSFWLWDLSEGPHEIEINAENAKTQMDIVNSRGSPGPDGLHPGVSRESEDEADKQWVINCYKTVLICEAKNRVSLENKIK